MYGLTASHTCSIHTSSVNSVHLATISVSCQCGKVVLTFPSLRRVVAASMSGAMNLSLSHGLQGGRVGKKRDILGSISQCAHVHMTHTHTSHNHTNMYTHTHTHVTHSHISLVSSLRTTMTNSKEEESLACRHHDYIELICYITTRA